MRYAWLAVFAVVMLGCSHRQHSNPFDPSNPDTQGRPLKLWAIPGEIYTRVHWSVPSMPDIETVTLVRVREGHDADMAMGDLALTGSWADPASTSDVTAYLLEVRVAGWNGVHRSDTSVAALSPGACWVASGYDHVALVSAHTETPLPSAALGSFIVDASSDETLWAAGMPGGMVYRVEMTPLGPSTIGFWGTSLAIRSISVSSHTARVLLAHANGLTWLDPGRDTLDPWPVPMASAPRLARLAPDEVGAWVWCMDGSLSWVVPGRDELACLLHLEGVDEISPGANRHCWASGPGGLFLADIAQVRRILSARIRAASAVSADECWVCLEDGSVALVTSRGEIIVSRSLGGEQLCYAPDTGMLWVAAEDTSLWKLLPTLHTAAHLPLAAIPWKLIPG